MFKEQTNKQTNKQASLSIKKMAHYDIQNSLSILKYNKQNHLEINMRQETGVGEKNLQETAFSQRNEDKGTPAGKYQQILSLGPA